MISAADILHGKILIVDDLKANVLLLERILVSAGYASVASTMNPLEVCQRHLENRYDVILLDLQMPGMDGFQVMDGLRGIEPGSYVPVLVITAQPDHKLRALKAGAKDFISKPFDLAEVLARVHNLLEVRLLHTELRKHNDVLEQRVSERTFDLQESYLETIFTMTRAAEHKDEDTGAHVQRISYYARALATMLGLGVLVNRLQRRNAGQSLGRDRHGCLWWLGTRHWPSEVPEAGGDHVGCLTRRRAEGEDLKAAT